MNTATLAQKLNNVSPLHAVVYEEPGLLLRFLYDPRNKTYFCFGFRERGNPYANMVLTAPRLNEIDRWLSYIYEPVASIPANGWLTLQAPPKHHADALEERILKAGTAWINLDGSKRCLLSFREGAWRCDIKSLRREQTVMSWYGEFMTVLITRGWYHGFDLTRIPVRNWSY